MSAGQNRRVKNTRLSALSLALAALLLSLVPATALAATDPGLGTAGSFAVLAGTTVTNTGPSWITGQLGVAPGSAVTGFPPGTSGVQHKGDSNATTAQTNLTAAYTNAAAQPCPGTNNFTGVNLGGKNLVPGVYCQTTAPTLTGTLTLNGSGIYIFQIGSTLVTASGARVVADRRGSALPGVLAGQQLGDDRHLDDLRRHDHGPGLDRDADRGHPQRPSPGPQRGGHAGHQPHHPVERMRIRRAGVCGPALRQHPSRHPGRPC